MIKSVGAVGCIFNLIILSTVFEIKAGPCKAKPFHINFPPVSQKISFFSSKNSSEYLFACHRTLRQEDLVSTA